MLRGITVGAGFFGRIHLEGWSRVENARITAVVDKVKGKAEECASRYGIAAYADVEEAIEREKPDFVDIVTRPDSHLQIARIAASKGCHVLCQKPIAPTWEESVELVETCRRSGVRLMINENWRWQPWYREIKRLIDLGAVGDVFAVTLIRHDPDAYYSPPFPNQPYFVDMERFLLIESVIHLIDVAGFLCGGIEGIFCRMMRVSGVTKGEDTLHIHLDLKGGAWGIIYSTRCSEPDVEEPVSDYARVEGRKGFIRLDRDGTITVKPLFEPERVHAYEIPKLGYRGDSCRAALQHFVDCLLRDEEFETEGEDYLKSVMKAVFAGYESAETGRFIKLESWPSRG
ncbi:gfo/Idh/MocA family oxidoreductase [Candidatus Poribacteria bacterium]|nr:MAG: gfo/Idh/MocA family oxidoreductase [Candidatus Poribacteria bacterium]